jgi:hypothetical protein
MPLVKSRVDVTTSFDRITADVNAAAKRAVEMAAREGAHVAAQVASSRSKSGRMAAIQVEPARGTVDGWEASFVSPVLYAWMQNYGTLGNRKKALKRPPRTKRTRAPGTGIEPLGFLDAGRRAGVAALRREIARGI